MQAHHIKCQAAKKQPEREGYMEENRNLLQADLGITYNVKKIDTEDPDMNSFLLRLGCYEGEPVTVVSKKKKSCVVVIKEGRYSIDNLLAEAIII